MFSMTLEDHIKADTEEMTPEIFKDLQQQGFREMQCPFVDIEDDDLFRGRNKSKTKQNRPTAKSQEK